MAWLTSILWLELAAKEKMKRWLFVGTLLSGLLITQSLIAISHYYGARAFNFRSDQLVASSIVATMVQKIGPDQQRPHRGLAKSHGGEGLKPLEEQNIDSPAPKFEKMQAWPSANSIRVEGNIVMVKLSD